MPTPRPPRHKPSTRSFHFQIFRADDDDERAKRFFHTARFSKLLFLRFLRSMRALMESAACWCSRSLSFCTTRISCTQSQMEDSSCLRLVPLFSPLTVNGSSFRSNLATAYQHSDAIDVGKIMSNLRPRLEHFFTAIVIQLNLYTAPLKPYYFFVSWAWLRHLISRDKSISGNFRSSNFNFFNYLDRDNSWSLFSRLYLIAPRFVHSRNKLKVFFLLLSNSPVIEKSWYLITLIEVWFW